MPELRDSLQAILGSGYTLERELGGGGMSRVFLAEDRALKRKVVVKVLAPELGAGVNLERFRREIAFAARLQHPHIVPLLNAGDADGIPYFTMPYVEGESLRARLQRDGELPVASGLRILREVASALAYAHEEGLVHRDIKPDNVLLSHGSAMVTDFGVAKAVSASSDPNATGITSLGIALGTPTYMAPEQATGAEAVDGRADIYAFGVMAYELFTGRPPFAGRNSQATLAAQITEKPEPIDRARPNLPPQLAALIMRCLEKRAADRPQSANEVIQQLDAVLTPSGGTMPFTAAMPARRNRIGVLAGAVAVVALVAVGVFMLMKGRAEAAPPMLVVLPFENLGASGDDYFADGLTEEITSRLSGVSGLGVIGRTSAQSYKGTSKPAREIARELGATHVLTGTVRWQKSANGESRVRISPQLVAAADQRSLWAEPYEGALSDVFKLQASVADRVASALQVALRAPAAGGSSGAQPTKSLEAYDAYLRGLANSVRAKAYEPIMRRRAIADLRRAVELDPSFVAAHARLARVYLTDGQHDSARVSADRAMRLDPRSLEARVARGYVLYAVDSAGRTIAYADSGLRELPSNVDFLVLKGLALWEAERGEEAVEAFEQAHRVDPRAPDPPAWLAGIVDELGRHEEAIRWREIEISLIPDNSAAYLAHAYSYLAWKGDTLMARRQMERGVAAVGVAKMGVLPPGRWFASSLGARYQATPEMLAFRDTATVATYGVSPSVFHRHKAQHFYSTGRMAAARAHADSALAEQRPGAAVNTRLTVARMHAIAGRRAEAAAAVDSGLALSRRGNGRGDAQSLVHAAMTEAMVGRTDSAVAHLERAFGLLHAFSITPTLLRLDPIWDPLRSNPGFHKLQRTGS